MFDVSPLKISLQVAMFSTAITFFLGLFAAHYIVRLDNVMRGFLDGILTLPMVMPPTVAGFFLLKTIGVNGPVGGFIMKMFQTKLVFTWKAAVVASVVVSLPLMYRTVRGAFENLDKNLVYSAQTLGRSNTYIFWKIILPNCRYGIIAGTILAFARGLGEFGATMMVAGNDALAYKWVLVNIAISFTVMLIMNFAGTDPKKMLQAGAGRRRV